MDSLLNFPVRMYKGLLTYFSPFFLGGVHAPCPFYNFPSCSLLFSIFCPLLLSRFFPAPFSFFCAPCSFFIFPLAPCSFFKFSTDPCSFLPFLVLLAPGLHLSAPLPILRLAPCSFVSNRACSLLRDYP